MILLIGGRGQLGQALQNALPENSFVLAPPVIGNMWAICDMARRPEIETVINCAAWTDVRGAENPENWLTVDLLNVAFPGTLARICRDHGKRFITFSTDYVFDGAKREPYTPEDRPNPINRYGLSKYAGEVICRNTGAVIIRTAGLFSPYGPNFVHTIFDRLRVQGVVNVTTALTTNVTSADSLARAVARTLEFATTPPGTYHYTDPEPVTWYDVAAQVAGAMGLAPDAVRPTEKGDGVTRPLFSALWCPVFDQNWRDEVARVVGIFKART
jgi:dTDP-4-dehydrorhamnose reductase